MQLQQSQRKRRATALDYIFKHSLHLLHALGLTDTTELHARWLIDYLENRGELTIMAHRESFKTSIISVGIALKLVLFPRRALGFFRKTDDDTADVVRNVAKYLCDPLIIRLSDMLWGFPIAITGKNNSEIETNYHIARLGEPALRAIGINGSLTGKHFYDITTDDIVNIKDRYSAAERENTKRFCYELVNVLNRGGVRTNTCTPWHKNDATAMFAGVRKYPVQTTGLFNEQQIAQKRRSMAAELFAINYELDLSAADESLFGKIGAAADFPQHSVAFAYLDPSHKGKDYTALCIGAMLFQRLIVCGFVWKKPWYDLFDSGALESIIGTLNAQTLTIETNGVGDMPVRMAKDAFGGSVRIFGINNTLPKIARIQTAAAFSESIDLVSFDDKPESQEFAAMIRDYDASAPHDDAPDSLAGLMESMKLIQVEK